MAVMIESDLRARLLRAYAPLDGIVALYAWESMPKCVSVWGVFDCDPPESLEIEQDLKRTWPDVIFTFCNVQAADCADLAKYRIL